MKLLADLHTHSKNSRFGHGKNSIEEMAISANEIGLVEIGITDHGYKHFFRTNKNKMKEARKVINEINEWSKTKVLLGIEADIMDEDGTLDIDNETLSMLDILIVGYHRMTMTDFAGYFGGVKKTAEAKQKCTNAFVNAIRKYPVTILAHLDSILETDMYEVGKACAERGTMVEINNRHTHWTREQMEDLIASGCMFVISSDAHSRNKVGEVNHAMDLIRKYDIPSERVANVEFTEEEKSQADREYEAYKSIYKKVEGEKAAREEKIQEKKTKEFGNSLSKEMEDELRKIAYERGETYETRKYEENYDGYINDNMDENERIIAMAEEYIRNSQMNEIDQENDNLADVDYTEEVEEEEDLRNNSIEGLYEDDGEVLSFDDNMPLMKDRDGGFNSKFQSINNLVKEAEKDEVAVKPVAPAPAKANSRVQINRTPSKKTVEVQSNTPKHNPRVTTPENFMSSITRTNLGKSQAQPEPKPEPAKQTRVATTRKKSAGGFIAVDGLIDGSKK